MFVSNLLYIFVQNLQIIYYKGSKFYSKIQIKGIKHFKNL